MTIHKSAQIHPNAVIEPGASIGPDCKVGPFCVIGAEVTLGRAVELKSHVAVAGITSIGDETRIWPFASIGHQPQDLKYAGERTRLEIGARNTIREYATMSPGTAGGGGVTRIGDDSLFMMTTHIGHDCQIGNRVIVANGSSVAGHCLIGDFVIIGGNSGVHQFSRIGRGAMIGAHSAVAADVIPYGMVTGERAHLVGLNLLGLKRRGVDKAEINALRAAYAEIFAGTSAMSEAAGLVAQKYNDHPLVAELADFIAGDSARHFTVPE